MVGADLMHALAHHVPGRLDDFASPQARSKRLGLEGPAKRERFVGRIGGNVIDGEKTGGAVVRIGAFRPLRFEQKRVTVGLGPRTGTMRWILQEAREGDCRLRAAVERDCPGERPPRSSNRPVLAYASALRTSFRAAAVSVPVAEGAIAVIVMSSLLLGYAATDAARLVLMRSRHKTVKLKHFAFFETRLVAATAFRALGRLA